jgi:hypothetical protein
MARGESRTRPALSIALPNAYFDSLDCGRGGRVTVSLSRLAQLSSRAVSARRAAPCKVRLRTSPKEVANRIFSTAP